MPVNSVVYSFIFYLWLLLIGGVGWVLIGIDAGVFLRLHVIVC